MPARGFDVIVHAVEVSDCRRMAGTALRRLPLEVDGRTARVEVTLAQQEKELSDDADEASPVADPVRFVDC